METSQKKIGFFKRIKIAIFKLEDYGMFLGERTSVAFNFFLILILLISLIISIVSSYNFYKMSNTAYSYIQNELPDFKYEDNVLKFERNVEAYDYDYRFRLYINTDDNVSEETLKTYKENMYSDDLGLVLLKDKVIYMLDGNTIEQTYQELFSDQELEQLGLNFANKQELVNSIQNIGFGALVNVYFVANFIGIFINNIITNLGYLLVVALFGYIAARFCGVRFKMPPMFSLSIYSLTLSIILSGIYLVVYMLTGFVIKYFDVMYLLIAYVYIIAAILMIKYDLIKQNEELQKIIEVQKQVKKELNEENDKNKKEPEKKEKNSEEKKEKQDDTGTKEEEPVVEENREPDGSEI